MILKELFALLGSAPRIQSREGLTTKKHTYIQALGPEMEFRPSGEYLGGKALQSSLQSKSHTQ